MPTPETRRQLLAAVQASEDKKGLDIRILELDPADSGLADFFLIASATNDRQVVAIADEIEFRLKKDFGLYATSVEGRRQAEWILLDYIDIVIHVFLEEKRAFYDIERLRKSARKLTGPELETELEDELRHALAEKTRAVRNARPAAKKTAAKSIVKKATKAVSAKDSTQGDLTVTAKPAKKAAVKTPLKAAVKKAALKAAARPAAKKAASAKTPLKSAAKAAPAKVGVVAPMSVLRGAKPPILKCEDPEVTAKVGVTAMSAKPPIVKCEDPEGNIVDVAASAATPAAKTAAKKAPAKAAKASLKAAAKKAKK